MKKLTRFIFFCLWLTRLVTGDLEDMQLAEKSHHMELKHHEDSLNPLHSLTMKSHVQSSQKNNIDD